MGRSRGDADGRATKEGRDIIFGSCRLGQKLTTPQHARSSTAGLTWCSHRYASAGLPSTTSNEMLVAWPGPLAGTACLRRWCTGGRYQKRRCRKLARVPFIFKLLLDSLLPAPPLLLLLLERRMAWALVPWKAKALMPECSASLAVLVGPGASWRAAAKLPEAVPSRALATYAFRLTRCIRGTHCCCQRREAALMMPITPAAVSAWPKYDLAAASSTAGPVYCRLRTAASAPTSMGSPRAVPAHGTAIGMFGMLPTRS